MKGTHYHKPRGERYRGPVYRSAANVVHALVDGRRVCDGAPIPQSLRTEGIGIRPRITCWSCIEKLRSI